MIQQALHFICAVFNKRNIQFQITGGFAAHIYGATRPINDIDIDVPDGCIQEIVADVQPYIVSGPHQIIDGCWDIYNLLLNYNGQLIDITESSVRILNQTTNLWYFHTADFSKAILMKVFDMEVPVMSKADLIQYKQWIVSPHFPHQQRDVEALCK